MLDNDYWAVLLGNDDWGLDAIDAMADSIEDFGFDINISLIKCNNEYTMGAHLRANYKGEEVDTESIAYGDKLSEVVEAVKNEISEDINGRQEDESKSAIEDKYEQEIRSLRTDNALLEQRISDLTAQVERYKKQQEKSALTSEQYKKLTDTLNKWYELMK